MSLMFLWLEGVFTGMNMVTDEPEEQLAIVAKKR